VHIHFSAKNKTLKNKKAFSLPKTNFGQPLQRTVGKLAVVTSIVIG